MVGRNRCTIDFDLWFSAVCLNHARNAHSVVFRQLRASR
jgi:hypothetical protein